MDRELLLALPDAVGIDGHGRASSLDEGKPEARRGRDESLLVRTLGLVLYFTGLLVLVKHNRVTEAKTRQKVVRIAAASCLIAELPHRQAGEGGVRGILADCVAGGSDASFLEPHDVLGEGPRLVAKDVLHLAKVATQVASPRRCRDILLLVVHLQVIIYVMGVGVVAHLHSNIQTDGDEVVVEDEEGEEVPPGVAAALPRAAVVQGCVGGDVVLGDPITQVPHLVSLPGLKGGVPDHG
mmetsp:Transcript_29622/g.58989  ORF Transcript_29622/g.58989 Transcript_29622/m.58989 type:complete len:239 (-) Transcript_29622:1129-1845(-)